MDRLIQFRNRPGLFAVLTPQIADAIEDGQMKLFYTAQGPVVELISRARKPLAIYDPGHRIVFVAVDPDGNLVLDS